MAIEISDRQDARHAGNAALKQGKHGHAVGGDDKTSVRKVVVVLCQLESDGASYVIHKQGLYDI